ncbi:hypothetical protein IE81DRAFT_173978 [Ceraceosorus guamensis]|uniref:Uncharacterized protein n=1 Tax=Ceraceosorus guamensis TaxID=1522189 RepID=A0A316VW27_9BASI|nr:hypothetical protein IE81DRAFT_173978 [Ceraceosorus guamensis]PWN41494.1 hypothetical protein IE81DRAFT_173978 [Ceraceosorus guamensis]
MLSSDKVADRGPNHLVLHSVARQKQFAYDGVGACVLTMVKFHRVALDQSRVVGCWAACKWLSKSQPHQSQSLCPPLSPPPASLLRKQEARKHESSGKKSWPALTRPHAPLLHFGRLVERCLLLTDTSLGKLEPDVGPLDSKGLARSQPASAPS